LRRHEFIPKPRSNFIKIKCPDCGNEQITFDRAHEEVHCTVCGAVMAEPKGGKISIKGETIEQLE